MVDESRVRAPSVEQADAAPRPAAGIRGFAQRHPQLAAWAALSLVMVALVLLSARDVNLLPMQRLSIVLATVGLAGLCVWIIGWD